MRGLRLMSWTTPKRVQIRKEIPIIDREVPRFHVPSKHKDYCKKLKGKHEYGWVENSSPRGLISWWEGTCGACGKKKTLWQKNPKN